MKRAIQRERRKKISKPPKSLSDLEIPNEWRTSKGDNCLQRSFRIISFSDQISTNLRRNFDRYPFDELSFDENSTNGRVRRDVSFDGKSHSTKSHGREPDFHS